MSCQCVTKLELGNEAEGGRLSDACSWSLCFNFIHQCYPVAGFYIIRFNTRRPAEEWQLHLDDTFGIFQNETCFDVVLQFTPESSRWVKGQIWHPQQHVIECDDGSIQLTIPVSHHTEIMMQILGHGAQVRVLAPDWLKEKVAKEIRRMSGLY